MELLRKALRAKPDFPEAHVLLSNALDETGRAGEAAEHLARAVEQRPGYAGAWHNYGVVLRKLERLDEAEDALRRAIELDAGYAPSYAALASLLRREGRIDEALKCYAGARARAPAALEFESAELFALLFSDVVSDDEILARHRANGARLEALHAPQRQVHRASREPERRLRVGYVSGELYRHPVALFVIPVLARHDRSKFEVRCYMTGAYRDSVTSELQHLADGWRDTASMGDSAMAQAIRGDEIDVLVDLSGHSGESRLGVFAHRPAPVQVYMAGVPEYHRPALHSVPSLRPPDRPCRQRAPPYRDAGATSGKPVELPPVSQRAARAGGALRTARLRHLRLLQRCRETFAHDPGALEELVTGASASAPVGGRSAGRANERAAAAQPRRRIPPHARAPGAPGSVLSAVQRGRHRARHHALQRRHDDLRRPLDGGAGNHRARPAAGVAQRREHAHHRRPRRMDRFEPGGLCAPRGRLRPQWRC